MKIRVIVPFMDKAFNDTITRQVGDIIDTDDAGFKCSEELAKERVAKGYCEVIEEPVVADIEIDSISYEVKGEILNEEIKPEAKIEIIKEKPAKKGKKASKKK